MFKPYAHAAQTMHLMSGLKHPAQSVPGLPRLPGTVKTGATRTIMDPSRRPPVIDVGAQPSLKIVPQADGSVQTILKRMARSADYMTAEDFRPLIRELEAVKADAIRMSQGRASLRELARRGHPYGRGLKHGLRRGRITSSGRSGIPNKAIINKQSGKLASLWSTRIERSKTGADFILEQGAPYAKYLAEGTARMQAHGPFAIAFIQHIQRINTLWLRAAKEAYLREQAMEAISG